MQTLDVVAASHLTSDRQDIEMALSLVDGS